MLLLDFGEVESYILEDGESAIHASNLEMKNMVLREIEEEEPRLWFAVVDGE
jgi:hypothetical protein